MRMTELPRYAWRKSPTYQLVLDELRNGWIHHEDAAAEVVMTLLRAGLITDDRPEG